MLNHFTSTHHFGFESSAWYWHFVDVVWLFLFIAVYWWGGIHYFNVFNHNQPTKMMNLVDMLGLGSSSFKSKGSSPFFGKSIINNKDYIYLKFKY